MQAVGLLQDLGHKRIRYYHGGMSDWTENGGPVETGELRGAPAMIPVAKRSERMRLSWSMAVDVLGQWSIDKLFLFWLAMIVVLGFIF